MPGYEMHMAWIVSDHEKEHQGAGGGVMRSKKVYRYYCEFCKKSGCSARHIKHHEERCTLNPNRKCGMCGLLEQEQPDLIGLMALLPKAPFIEDDNGGYYQGTELTKEFIDASGGCPACTMAAMRQSKIPVHAYTNFDFTKECKSIWEEFNNFKQEYY